MFRRFRINWPFWLTCVGTIAFLGLLVAWPLLRPPAEESSWRFQHSLDDLRERAMEVLAAVWFFVLGATIGSFLNVVAYRMPMGLTFVAKPSRCPYCLSPILFRHNVPLFGWIALRGRCFRCRLPISPRYVLVELLTGCLFLGLYLALFYAGGVNVPLRTPSRHWGAMWNLFIPQWDLVGIYVYQAYLVSTLTTIALMKWDRFRVPVRLGLFSVLVGWGGQLCWPELQPVPSLGTIFSGTLIGRMADPLIGLALGMLLGAVLQRLLGGVRLSRGSRGGSVIVFGLVGLFLGWQMCVPCLLLASLFQLLVTSVCHWMEIGSERFWAFSFLLGSWLGIVGWNGLPEVWIPGPLSSGSALGACLLFALGVVYIARSWAPQESVPVGS